MIKDLWKKLLVPVMLLILFFISLGVFRSELISALILLTCVGITFSVKHYNREWLLFAIGTALGVLFEIGGDLFFKLQYWENASLFGIPYWLPLFWGFVFVIIYRIGSMIVKK
jgi:hypothetical protein